MLGVVSFCFPDRPFYVLPMSIVPAVTRSMVVLALLVVWKNTLISTVFRV